MRLTKDEIKLVAFLLGALLIGISIKSYRHRHRIELPPPSAEAPSATKAEVDFE